MFTVNRTVQAASKLTGYRYGVNEMSNQERKVLRDLAQMVQTDSIDEADERLRDQFREMRDEVTRFLLPYKFAIEEICTKLNILKEEFTELGNYNPIEHVSSRLKSPESILAKIERRGLSGEMSEIRSNLTDIAGVRVVCSFITDVYHVFELLTQQDDITVLQIKDYIANPKPNGYRSLHVLLELPVFLSSGPVTTVVEVQFRTIAMDFWASLEHKIYYKYDREVPTDLIEGLREAADSAGELDSRMEWLHIAIRGADRDTRVRRSADSMQAVEKSRAQALAEAEVEAAQQRTAEVEQAAQEDGSKIVNAEFEDPNVTESAEQNLRP
ncbi:MAG: GTP pyrophosphokinase [Canibacter sp.]